MRALESRADRRDAKLDLRAKSGMEQRALSAHGETCPRGRSQRDRTLERIRFRRGLIGSVRRRVWSVRQGQCVLVSEAETVVDEHDARRFESIDGGGVEPV